MEPESNTTVKAKSKNRQNSSTKQMALDFPLTPLKLIHISMRKDPILKMDDIHPNVILR